jgi:tetratricopeptide (TPR) repeat protein
VSSTPRLAGCTRLFPHALPSWASRAPSRTVSGIGASFWLPCLIAFLWCVAPARAQDSQRNGQEGAPPKSPASAAQASFPSDVAKNAVKPSEHPTPDPALAPARSFLHEGRLSEAESATRDYLRAHADSADAHFLLGFILFREVQAKWLEAGKGQSESLLYSGGDTSGAVAQFRDAKAKDSLAEFTAGAKYHVPGAFDLKIVALDYILLKDNRDADHWLTRSLQADPRDAQAWYYLGRTKYSSGQFREAIEAFEQCLKLEPRNIEAENNVGLSFEALDRPGEAIQAFETAIAWQADSPAKDPEPFIELAHLYLNENQPEKAVPYLSESIAIHPNVSKAHEELGKAYSLLQRLPEAQAELEKAVELSPQAPNLHCMLAGVYRKRGLADKAKAEYDRCATLTGTHSTS